MQGIIPEGECGYLLKILCQAVADVIIIKEPNYLRISGKI